MLPTIFFGHGNPMNAISSNVYADGWRRIGQEIPRPRAILCISAHWFVPETGITVSPAPRTIHDFWGFPEELYQVEYPAPGDPELAQEVQKLLLPLNVVPDISWGLDHGTWSVLRHVYPEADVPVLQLSLDSTRPAAFHYELGRKLAPLRGEGILIAGSGNVIHNLRTYDWSGKRRDPYDWAVRFENRIRELILAGDIQQVVDYQSLGPDAALSVPTPEHFLPLLYVLGSAQPGESIRFPVEGMEGGSISMLSVQVE